MYRRHIQQNLYAALADTPVVLLNGPRQSGKTTLAQMVVRERPDATYLTLDDAGILAAASGDPAAFVSGPAGLMVIDEVQKVPGLFPAIKVQVDRDRRPGRYLLTGSANVFMLPRLSESLAGRMEVLTLWPLSQGEIEGVREGFVDGVFASDLPAFWEKSPNAADLMERALRGGYPEVIGRRTQARRTAWFRSYVTAILQRDVRDLANIEGLTDMPRLLALLAARVGSLMNVAEFSRSLGFPYVTLRRYLTLLETTFLLQDLPAWSGNLAKRLIKAPKVNFTDTGVVSHLTGLTSRTPREQRDLGGHVLENFVVMELRKQLAWSQVSASLFHFRTSAGREVDVVLEDAAGRIVGIEIKASATLASKDFSGLRALAEGVGPRFQRGVVLYGGEDVIRFGQNLLALPASAIWRMEAQVGIHDEIDGE